MFTKLLKIYIICNFCELLAIPDSLQTNKPLKILVYSQSLSWSHCQFLGKIADTLQEAGHDVHFLKFLSDPEMAKKNETRLVQKFYIVEYKNKNANLKQMIGVNHAFGGHFWPSFLNHRWNHFLPFASLICQEMVENQELLDRLANEHFDVGIGEMYDLCAIGIFHRIGVRTKLATLAVPMFQMAARRFGIPTFSSFVPNVFPSSMYDLKTSFLGRLLNFYNDFYEWFVTNDRMEQLIVGPKELQYNDFYEWFVINERMEQLIDPMFQRAFGKDFPRVGQLVGNVSLIFTNSNPFFEMPKPTSNKVVYIGGIVTSNDANEKQPKLNDQLQSILDNAKHGAVLFSFGLLASTEHMPATMRHAFFRAFGHFPDVKFLCKLDNGSIRNSSTLLAKLPNVHTFDWLPQTAVLAHPNMRAFITHCGWNSLSEAAQAGVPVIGVPLFGDQWYNSLVTIHTGMGIHLNVRHLNSQQADQIVAKALEKILNDRQHRRNAQLIQRKLAFYPNSAKENLAHWVEFAAQFPDGLTELNLPGDEAISWFIYYSVDIILFTLATLLAISATIIWSVTTDQCIPAVEKRNSFWHKT